MKQNNDSRRLPVTQILLFLWVLAVLAGSLLFFYLPKFREVFPS